MALLLYMASCNALARWDCAEAAAAVYTTLQALTDGRQRSMQGLHCCSFAMLRLHLDHCT